MGKDEIVRPGLVTLAVALILTADWRLSPTAQSSIDS